MVRKDVADAAILALEDMRTQMMARIAELEAENERLREYPTSLCLHLLWHRRNGPPTCFGCGAILRDGRWVSLAEQAAEAATYYEEEADDD